MGFDVFLLGYYAGGSGLSVFFCAGFVNWASVDDFVGCHGVWWLFVGSVNFDGV